MQGLSQWSSWADFWHMGGYGLYVWGSYAVALGVMAGEAALVRARHRRALAAARDLDAGERA